MVLSKQQERIPLFRPPRLKGKYLDGVLSSGHLTTGPMVERLREALGEYFGVFPGLIALGASATACFQALRDHLDESWFQFDGPTWPLLVQIAHEQGKIRGFACQRVDVVTDIGGTMRLPGPKWPTSWAVHDACHGWTYQHADYTLLSFYPTKLCGAAEGGALIFNGPEAGVEAEEVQLLLNSGIPGAGSAPDYSRADPRGRKANMTDVQAALALEALEDLPRRKEAARSDWEIAESYFSEFCGDQVTVKPQPIQPYLFQVKCSDVPRAIGLLRAAGVGAAWNFPPSQWLTVPMWGSEPQVPYVVEVVARALREVGDDSEL